MTLLLLPFFMLPSPTVPLFLPLYYINKTLESLELERCTQVQNMLVKYSQLVETIIRPTEQVTSSPPSLFTPHPAPSPLTYMYHPSQSSSLYSLSHHHQPLFTSLPHQPSLFTHLPNITLAFTRSPPHHHPSRSLCLHVLTSLPSLLTLHPLPQHHPSLFTHFPNITSRSSLTSPLALHSLPQHHSSLFTHFPNITPHSSLTSPTSPLTLHIHVHCTLYHSPLPRRVRT